MNRVVYGLVLSVIGLVVIIALAIIPISIMAPLYQVLNPGTGIWVNKLPS
ncbi:hypothetical protein [Vulcanisaeta souniana]|nr:hypothetical protein [Vulcanisaeta souniana]